MCLKPFCRVRRDSGGCLEGVLEVSDRCLEGVKMVSGKCMEVVLKVSGRCLNDVWKVYGSCPEGIWKVSGMDLESSCKHACKYQIQVCKCAKFSLEKSFTSIKVCK